MRDFKTPGYEDLELSTQILIKEALRRGIEVEVIDRKNNFISLKRGNKIEYIKQATQTSADSFVTALLMENKMVTKKLLKERSIRAPEGEIYDDVHQALSSYSRFSDIDVVIKPNSTNFGIGVSVVKKTQPKKDYAKAVEEAFRYDNSVIVEEFIHGKEYRFLIIGEEVAAILHRVPANVIGDGEHTVEELVCAKNESPLRGKGYKTPLEKISLGDMEKSFLEERGKNFQYIPQKGKKVFLRKISNISTGGDSIDFTDDVSDKYKSIAVEAATAVGARICGADIIIQDIRADPKEDNYGIIELNFNPALHIHSFPYKGKNRHVGEKVLDLLGF